MLARLRGLWRLLALLAAAEKDWRRPRRSAVLIFDATRHDVLLDHVGAWKPEVLHVRGERVYVQMFLASLLDGAGFWEGYFDRVIAAVQPKLVVTMIDNNPRFFALRSRHGNLKTLCVQNGWKGYYADIFELLDTAPPKRRAEFQVDYLLTFGTAVSGEYAKYLRGEITAVGSLRNNQTPVRDTRIPGTIAFISQWGDESFSMGTLQLPGDRFCREADTIVLPVIKRVAAETGRRLLIVPRYRQPGVERTKEVAYYLELLGREPEFLEFDDRDSSYRAIDSAELVVAVDTTLAYEAIARGAKTAILSIRTVLFNVPALNYGWPAPLADDGPFWTNRPDPATFERLLKSLLEQDHAEWRHAVARSGFEQLMTYDAGNTMLAGILSRELGPA